MSMSQVPVRGRNGKPDRENARPGLAPGDRAKKEGGTIARS
ncbi:protein of unknown function [Kyrpidia spormannii]|uniref:Uncharacterized protein n=1 Tax=Kyrpidia spormannii TaxID=2055160 RepID=A0ACA8ZD15_9BACL|nr:protein of unknown function [Kyrpidia spormannii]